jgi:hypothetical protein
MSEKKAKILTKQFTGTSQKTEKLQCLMSKKILNFFGIIWVNLLF